MPPPGRYGPQGVNTNFQHMQPSQYQPHQQPQQHHQAQHNAMPLPTAGLGGHPGFMTGMSLPGSNMNSSAFDGARLADGGGTGLASHSAQMSFARGGQMPQQQQARMQDGQIGNDGKTSLAKSRIRNVWKNNLASEMHTLRQLVDKYPYIAMVFSAPSLSCCFLPADGVEGYRVSRNCGTSHWTVHNKGGLSLSDIALQCRPPQNDTARHHTFCAGWHFTSSNRSHESSDELSRKLRPFTILVAIQLCLLFVIR